MKHLLLGACLLVAYLLVAGITNAQMRKWYPVEDCTPVITETMSVRVYEAMKEAEAACEYRNSDRATGRFFASTFWPVALPVIAGMKAGEEGT